MKRHVVVVYGDPFCIKTLLSMSLLAELHGRDNWVVRVVA